MQKNVFIPQLCGSFVILVLLASLWWIGIHILHIPSYFLPSIASVMASLQDNFILLISSTGYTLAEGILGFMLAFAAAFIIASLAYFIPTLALLLQPLALLSQALPLMVLSPLLVLWLGFAWASKLTIVALSLFFPMFIANLNGFKATPKLWLDLAFTMQDELKPLRLFRYVILPGALSHTASGIKISIAWSMLAAIVAEWVGGNNGLGFLMQNALSRLDSAFLFSSLLLLILSSLTLYGLMSCLLASFTSNVHDNVNF